MNMRVVVVALSAVVAVVSGGASVVQQPGTGQPGRENAGDKSNRIDLRPKFKVGQSVRFKMTMKSDSGEEGGQSMEQEIVLKMTTRSGDVEKGSTVEMLYESLKFKLNAGDMDVSFDSTKPDKNNPYDSILRPLVGLKMNVVFDTDGNITSVSGDESGGGLSGMVAGQFSGADVARGVFGPIAGTRKGDGHAAVGESWTNEDVISGGLGSTQVKTTNTLESVKGGRANISIKGSVLLDGSGSTGLPMVNIKDSTLKGKAVWDVEAGMLESMTQEQTLSIEAPSLEMDPDAKPTKGDRPTLTKHTMKVSVNRLK